LRTAQGGPEGNQETGGNSVNQTRGRGKAMDWGNPTKSNPLKTHAIGAKKSNHLRKAK